MIPAVQTFSGEYAFLSNFYASEFTWNGTTWPTSELAYQASKCSDESEHRIMLTMQTPVAAKRYGKIVKIRNDWELVKVEIMRSIVRAKFLQNVELAEKLINTEGLYLAEGNHWKDRFWGVCPAGPITLKDGVPVNGKNNLGIILMDLRAELLARGTEPNFAELSQK